MFYYIKKLIGGYVKPQISAEYFAKMLSPDSLNLSKPFNDEEDLILNSQITKVQDRKIKNMVVFGAGPLLHLEFANKFNLRYIAVEPNASKFTHSHGGLNHKVSVVNGSFESFNPEVLQKGATLYVFVFNVISYLKDSAKKINQITKPGDIVFISTWSKNKRALGVREKYIKHLNYCTKSQHVNPTSTEKITDLTHFKAKVGLESELIKGKICNILMFYK